MKRIVPSILGLVLLLVSCGNDPQADTTKPVVTLVSSKASVTAAESIKLTATATDNVGVTKVEFYDGATKLGEDSSSPYEFDVVLAAANNGSRSYKAKAFDAASNEGSSDAVVVAVNIAVSDIVKPTVSLAASKTVVTVEEGIKLTATATDNVGVTKVEFYEGATYLGQDSSSPYEFNIALEAANNGLRSYKAKAFDAAGNEGSSDAVAVTVAIAITPTITVTGTVISVNGRASGAKVLLNNGNLQTTDANGSFTYNSVTVPYSLTVAYGDQVFVSEGLTRSDPLTFIVPFAAFGGSYVSGKVTGPTYPLVGRDDIAIGSSGYIMRSTSRVFGGSGQFGANIEWSPTSETNTVDLAALRYTSGYDGSNNLVITDFLKMGKRTGVTLTRGVEQTDLDIALDTPVPVSSTTFTSSKGAYRSAFGGGIYTVNTGGMKFWLDFPFPSGSITTKIPSEGASFYVSGSDTVGNQAYIVAPAVIDGLTAISLPDTTQVSNSTPIPDAANISVTPTLTWNSLPGATAYVVFLSSSVRTYRIYLPGTSSSYTIPDFAAASAGLQPNTSYTWQVYGIKSANLTPDAFAEPSQDTFLKLGSGLIGFESYTSKATSFTTAP